MSAGQAAIRSRRFSIHTASAAGISGLPEHDACALVLGRFVEDIGERVHASHRLLCRNSIDANASDVGEVSCVHLVYAS